MDAWVLPSALDGSGFITTDGFFGREGISTQNVCRFLGRGLDWSPSPLRFPCEYCGGSTMTMSLSHSDRAGLGSRSDCTAGSSLIRTDVAVSRKNFCRIDQRFAFVTESNRRANRIFSFNLMFSFSLDFTLNHAGARIKALFLFGTVLSDGFLWWNTFVGLIVPIRDGVRHLCLQPKNPETPTSSTFRSRAAPSCSLRLRFSSFNSAFSARTSRNSLSKSAMWSAESMQ